jgi:nucleoid DNA-binding protein
MTKREMAQQIACKVGLTPAQALAVVQHVFDGILATLLEHGRMELRNFGVFAVKKRRPRQARNPRTGESVAVPEKWVVTFKPGRAMQARVHQSGDAPGR